MEVKTMCSEKQTEANRLNAQKSTGPKTPEGKERVSQNAITHGLCSTRPILSTEDPEKYDQLRGDFFRRYTPEGAFENVLAERAFNTFWRLQRASTFETLITNSLLGQAIDAIKQKFAGNPNFRLSDLTAQDYLAVVIENDFSKEQTLERIQRYELRIENSHYRILRELRKLQSQRLQQTEGKLTEGKSSVASAKEDKPNPIQSKPKIPPFNPLQLLENIKTNPIDLDPLTKIMMKKDNFRPYAKKAM
jgi:hypothetical protein